MISLLRKTALFSLFLLSGLLFNSTMVLAATKTPPESLDKIVAVVNDSVITDSELNESIASVKKQLAASNTSAPTPENIRKHVLDQLIDRKLQIGLAEQGGLKITDKQVNNAIEGVAKQNNVSVQELYEKVAETGLDAAAYRKEIREEMIIQAIQQHEVGAHISISSQEIDDFMRSATWKTFNNKEYHLEDILIALPATPSSQDVANAKKRAQEVLTKIQQGMSFSDVAASDSSNSQALQGGDLGWLRLPQIPTEFASELTRHKENDIIGPLATTNGFHIIQLLGVRNVTPGSAAEQRKQVEQLIYQRKMQEGLQTWLATLHSQAFINTNPPG